MITSDNSVVERTLTNPKEIFTDSEIEWLKNNAPEEFDENGLLIKYIIRKANNSESIPTN